MNDSILTSIKLKMLMSPEDDEYIDPSIIMAINTAIFILNQIGIGPDDFEITGKGDVWSDFINDKTVLNAVKTFIYLSVKLDVDPPASNAVMECYKRKLDELTSRLNIQVDI